MSVAPCTDRRALRARWLGCLGLLVLPWLSSTARASGCDGPLLLAYPADRPPLSSTQHGQPQGLVAEYVSLLQQRHPTLRVQPIAATALADGTVPEGVHALLGWPQAQRPAGWLVSTPYLQVPQMIVQRRERPPIIGLEGLRGRIVASADLQPLALHLAQEAPGAQLLPQVALEESLRLLASGQVDAVVTSAVEADIALRQRHDQRLLVAAPAGFGDALVLAALPACAPLLTDFNRLLRERSTAQHDGANARWMPTPAITTPAPHPALYWLVPALLVLLALGLIHALGYWRLHREGIRRRGLEQRLQDVTANLPAVVYRARRSSRGEYSVPYIAGDVHALFGVSVDSARVNHSHLLAAVHPEDRGPVLRHVDAAALARGPIDVTFRTRSPQGWRWVRSHGQPVACSDSGVEWCGYWMDVTEAQSRTRALNQARRDAVQAGAARTHFLASMSHEIRTPMSTVLGMLECLAATPLDAQQRQRLATLEDAAAMLRQILDDVLDGQALPLRPSSPQSLPLDLAALLQGVHCLLAPLAAVKGLQLQCVLDPALQPGSLADGLRLRQILINLVGNALKFTPLGAIELRLQVLQQQPEGQLLRLQVTDTGVGISDVRQHAVFAAFIQADSSTTRRFGGSGLGLTICRDLAASMGAQLQLHSVLGKGTRVWLDLYLPACVLPPASPRRQASDTPALPTVAVLVAEDHPTNLQLLVQRLRELGLRVHATANGETAWQAWQAQCFALVITDIHMPGMDGFALARAIRSDPRAHAAGVPIIALSASALDSTREASRAAGIDHFLAKPIDRAALHAAVAALLLPASACQ